MSTAARRQDRTTIAGMLGVIAFCAVGLTLTSVGGPATVACLLALPVPSFLYVTVVRRWMLSRSEVHDDRPAVLTNILLSVGLVFIATLSLSLAVAGVYAWGIPAFQLMRDLGR